MNKLFVIIFILFQEFVFGQIKYKSVPLKNGMPNQIKFKWEKAEYASIDISNFYKNLFLIYKDTNSFNNSIFYTLIYKDGSFDISRVELKQSKANEYTSILKLRTISGDELSPLNIIVFPIEKRVKYIWGDSINGFSLKPKIINEYKLKVGKTFPSLSLESPNGILDLDTLNRKIIVINWWATSCLPCRMEIPGLNKLVKKYKNKPVIFLSIIWDKENLDEFLKKHPFNYSHSYSNAEAEKLLGGTFPVNIVIDKNHKIIYNKRGATTDTWKILDKIISSKL